MVDARTFPKTLEDARAVLEKEHALYKGEYLITDKIYIAKDISQPLEKVFLRLRLVPKNIWDEKPCIVTIKNTELKSVGKQSIIPVKKEFDTEADAEAFIATEYGNQFVFSFTFHRIGWQYFLGEDGIDLEDIEGHPSIEFKSKTEEGLAALLTLFKVSPADVIQGPSVVAVKELLGR
jgi:hypothetical protein